MKLKTERREELKENLSGIEKILIWQEEMTSKNFAEEYVYLPKTNAIGAGQPVDFKYSPHIIKPMEVFDSIYTQEIWLMFASQMSKTLFLFIEWAKTAKLNPKSMVWMISKIEAIARYQKEKITDLVNASIELNTVIQEGLEEQKKSRSKMGVIHHQGATTYLIGAKADDDKKSVTTKIVIVDEADEMDGIAAITPLWERAKTFLDSGAKLIVASTKKTKNGTITQGFNSCEQKNFLGMECPHCKQLIEVHHRQLRIMEAKEYKREFKIKDEDFTEDIISEQYIPYASKKVYYECQECQQKITSSQKKRQIVKQKIGWIVQGVKEKPKTVGFSANSLLSYFVPFEDIAKTFLRAEMQKDKIVRAEMLAKFYEGYYNDYYDARRNDISKSDDILMLGSGYKKREISEDIKAVYMTIDTQKGHKDKDKDHYWYMIGGFDSKMNFYLIESGKIFKDKDIYTKIFSKYNRGSKTLGIRRVLWDIQGHGEIETLALIAKINSIIGTIAYEDEEKRNYVIYPYRGMSEIQNKTYRLQVEEKSTTGLMENKYPIIIGNSKRGKDSLYNAISKAVKFMKGDEVENPEQNMFWINDDEVEDGVRRLKQKREEGTKIPNESLEKQLTSEVWGLIENSKAKEGWHTLYKGRDNHLWDCGYMMYIALDFDNLQSRVFNR